MSLNTRSAENLASPTSVGTTSLSSPDRDRKAVEDLITGDWARAEVQHLSGRLLGELEHVGFVCDPSWGGDRLGLDEDDKRFVEASGLVKDPVSGALLVVSATLCATTEPNVFGWAQAYLTIQRMDVFLAEALTPTVEREPSLVYRGVYLCDPLGPGERQADRSAQLLERVQAASARAQDNELGRLLGFTVTAVEREFAQ